MSVRSSTNQVTDRRSQLRRAKIGRWAKYLVLTAAMIVAVAPVYWMVTISLKSEVDQFASPPRWFSFPPTLAHYYDAFLTRSFGRYLMTSVIVAGLSTICAVTLGTLAAYGLARFRLRGKLDQRLSLWILSTRMFPPIVTAVPLFLMMRDVRLLNTITSLVIVYTALNLPFVVWMMRGFFASCLASWKRRQWWMAIHGLARSFE